MPLPPYAFVNPGNGGVVGVMRIVKEYSKKGTKDKLCLVHVGMTYQIEYWTRTRRKKSPYTRTVIGEVVGFNLVDGFSAGDPIQRKCKWMYSIKEDLVSTVQVDLVHST